MGISGSDDGQRAQELLEKGASLYEEGKLYEAISCWRQVLMLDPDNEIAAEYLRFIEDNFQIGIDTFLEHNRGNAPPTGSFDGPDDDIAAAIDDSINAMLDESIEELDWTELLDDGIEPADPPPPSEVAELDEAFFADLEPGSLESDPGAEAEAWGKSLRSPTFGTTGSGLSPAGGSLEMMPDSDPFTLPTEAFAVEYAPGEVDPGLELLGSDPLGDSVDGGEPAAPGDSHPGASQPGSSQPGSSQPGASQPGSQPGSSHPGSSQPGSSQPGSSQPGASQPGASQPGSARPGAGSTERKDLADMSEDSIDSLLDEDFKAWERSPAPAAEAADSFELPFETGGPSRPGAAAPDARPSKPALDARGAPVERRRPPSFQAPAVNHPGLQRHTGPLEAVDPRTRERLGVERVARTTPPVAIDIPVEAVPEPVDRPSPAAEPTPEPAPEHGAPPSARRPRRSDPGDDSAERAAERQRATDRAQRRRAADGAERKRAADALEAAERQLAAEAARAEPTTDLDDELRALLTVGIAEIEAVEQPGASSRPRRLITAPPPGTDLDALMVDARRRQQADDFSGAIELVEQVLAGDPNHQEARRYLEANTDRLLAMYRARLGSLGRVPRVKLRQQEIVWQSLDHREGFILSQVDGRTSFEEIIDISGMAQLESTRILARLVDHGVIG